jgi:hypothetical protein
VLPPVNVQIVECEPSEAESDFYQALFRRSQVGLKKDEKKTVQTNENSQAVKFCSYL